jgi:hypothetical protein
VDTDLDSAREWIDSLFVEQLWCTVKYEKVHLHAYRDGAQSAAASLVLLQVLQCSWSSPGIDPKRRDASSPHSIVSRMPALA